MRSILNFAATATFAFYFVFQPAAYNSTPVVVGKFATYLECTAAAAGAVARSQGSRILVDCWEGPA